MKHKNYLVCLLMLIAVVSSAQNKVNIQGHWDMKVESPMGNGSPTFELKQATDGTISGTYEGRLGEAAVTGTVKGTIVHLEFSINGNMIKYEGTTDGDTMKGKINFASQAEGTFSGTRKK